MVNYRADTQQLDACRAFVKDLTAKLQNIPLFTSDEMGSYMVALWEAYRIDKTLAWDSLPYAERPGAVDPDLDYAIFHKERKNCHVVGTEIKIVFGEEHRIYLRMKGSPCKQVNTSFVERFNGTLRLHDAHLIRLSQRFAKNIEYFKARLAIIIAYYNFVRPHGTLSRPKGESYKPTTPAMAKGITDRPLDFRELLATPFITTVV